MPYLRNFRGIRDRKEYRTYLNYKIRFLALGWHLEEIHVTWAHLEKKRTRLRTYTKFMEKYCLQNTVRVRKDTTPISVHNIYSFYKSESYESEPEDVEGVDIETLTLEQYLALYHSNSRNGIRRLENTPFEIKGQFLRELRNNTFSGNNTDDAIEHIGKNLEVASLFNAGDATLLRVFPLALVGTTKRWFERTSPEQTKTWNELRKIFIRRLCPPATIIRRLGEIQNFRQEEGESLFHTWERYNDLLFKCPFHDLNDYQKADHSHKWHNEESKNLPNLFNIIIEKLKALNHDMDELRVSVRKINEKPRDGDLYEEVKSIKTSEVNYDNLKSCPKIIAPPKNLEDTFEQYLKESCKRQEVLNKCMKQLIENTYANLKHHDYAIKKLEEKVNHLVQMITATNLATTVRKECAMKLEPPHEPTIPMVETFVEKVKKRILNDQENGEKLLRKLEKEPVNTTLVNTIRETPEYTRHLHELVSHKAKIEMLSMVKLNARCSVVLQNELPPKEKDPRSFIFPCTIGNTTVSNALADLGASISVMPFFTSKRLGLGNPKPINMVIEMADRSMQSPKGIVENVVVKINKFIFPVDFVILDIIEDDKVPIILGRPMLATAHARTNVSEKKISLEVGTEQIIFDINEREPPSIISHVCVINNFQIIDEFKAPEDLEELLMNNDINMDLGSFIEDNDLLSSLDTQDVISLSSPNSAEVNDEPNKAFNDFDNNLNVDDFVEGTEDIWDDLDPWVLTNDMVDPPRRPEFLYIGNRVHIHNPYNFQISCKIGFVNFNPYIKPKSPFNVMSSAAYNNIMRQELMYTGNNMIGLAKNLYVFVGCHEFLIDFIILENIDEFVEKGLTEVLFKKPFKDQVGIIEDINKGVL
ncbi:homeodomain-like protein [Tanacetum coccineum]